MTRASTEGPDRATLIAFAAVVAFGGLNAIAVKATVAELDPLWGAGLRFLVAGLAMAALALVRGRAFPKGRALGGSMLYGIVGFAAAFGFIYTGLRDVQAGAAAVVLALSPLATYALAVAQRQESFYPRAVGGALVALVGVSVVFAEEVSFAAPVGSLALIFAGMVCLSEAGVIVKQIPRSDPFATNAVAMLTAAVALIILALLAGERPALPTQPGTWLAVGYVIVLGSVALFGLYVFGLNRWTASGMSYTTLLLPFVSVAAATVLTGERFTIAFVAGGIVMLAGVYLGAFGLARPRRSTATSLPECLPIADCRDEATNAAASRA